MIIIHKILFSIALQVFNKLLSLATQAATQKFLYDTWTNMLISTLGVSPGNKQAWEMTETFFPQPTTECSHWTSSAPPLSPPQGTNVTIHCLRKIMINLCRVQNSHGKLTLRCKSEKNSIFMVYFSILDVYLSFQRKKNTIPALVHNYFWLVLTTLSQIWRLENSSKTSFLKSSGSTLGHWIFFWGGEGEPLTH